MREAELDKSPQECQTLTGKPQEMDSMLVQGRAEIDNMRPEPQEAHNELQKRLDNFAITEAQLGEITMEAQRLKKEKDRLESEVVQLTILLLKAENTVSETRAALEEVRRDVQRRDNILQAANERLGLLCRKFGQGSIGLQEISLDARLEQIENILCAFDNSVKDGELIKLHRDEILRSSSWRVTAPARWIMQKFQSKK